MLKRLLTFLVYASLIFVVILILSVGFTQTSYFKEQVRSYLLSSLREQINGSLVLGAIRGNFLTGFTVDSLSIIYQGTPVITSGLITYTHDPLALLRKEVRIQRLAIHQPQLRLIRSSDSAWNISRVFKSSSDTSKGSFDWTIVFETLDLTNAEVTVVDSLRTSSSGPGPEIRHYNRGHVRLSARIRHNDITAQIHTMRGRLQSPEIRVRNITGDLSLTDRSLLVRNLIVQTDSSRIQIDAAMVASDPATFLSSESMERDSARLKIAARNVDLPELKTLLNLPEIPDGNFALDIDVIGQLGNLTLKRCIIRSPKSTVNVIGKIHNLSRPGEAYFDLFAGDSKINLEEIHHFFPELKAPSFERVGEIAFYGQFTGTTSQFKSTATLKGQFGELVASGDFSFSKPVPSYSFSFTASNLKVSDFLDGDEGPFVVTAKGEVDGKGTNRETLSGTLAIRIDSARLFRYSLTPSMIRVAATPNQFRVNAELTSGTMSAKVNGDFDLSELDRPVYAGDAEVRSLNLETALADRRFQSDLNFDARFSGSGTNIAEVTGYSTVSLHPSVLHGVKLPADTIMAALERPTSQTRKLSISSRALRADLEGTFALDKIFTLIPARLSHTIREFTGRLSSDSLHQGNAAGIGSPRVRSERNAFDFAYDVSVTNFDLVSAFITEQPFNFQGNARGTMRGNDRELSFVSRGTLDQFFAGTMQKGVLLQQVAFDIDARNMLDEGTLSVFSADVAVDCAVANINATVLDSTSLRLSFANRRSRVTVRSEINKRFIVRAGGLVGVSDTSYSFDLDTLDLGIGGVTWSNLDQVSGEFGRTGLELERLSMGHAGESLKVWGTLNPGGPVGARAELSNVNIEPIERYLGRDGMNTFAGTIDGSVRLTGTMESPTFDIALTGDSLAYKSTRLGSLTSEVRYEEETATFKIRNTASGDDTAAVMKIEGTVPVNLALAPVDDRFPDRQQHIRVYSNGLPLAFVESLLPDLQNITGDLVADLTIAGTPNSPEYRGGVTLREARFTFRPNNIAYIATGDLTPSQNTVTLRNFKLRNVPEERLGGEAAIEGSLTIRDFQLSSFDLSGRGDLLLMSEASRASMTTLYGTLFARLDPEGFSLTGSPQEPYMSGRLFILDADLIFPPTRVEALTGQSLTLRYVSIDDTTKPKETPSRFSQRFFDSPGMVGPDVSQIVGAPSSGGFVDKLRYDLTVETYGPTRIKMIFTPSTNEELYAELEGTVRALNLDGTPNIYGEISIGKRSYYNFLKRFDATGTLKFVGPWDNPQMDIEARYESYARFTDRGASVSDTSQASTEDRKVIVMLSIDGTRYEPKLNLALKVQEDPDSEPVDWASKSGDVESDAISFILTGKFKDQLTSQDNQNLLEGAGSSAGTTMFSGFTTGFLSGILTEFLRKEFPWIRSVDLSFRGGNIQESADLRISGEAFEGFWRFGGKIVNDIGNANVSYQVSLGNVFSRETLRNLFVELERRVNGENSNETDKKSVNTARVYYRISF